LLDRGHHGISPLFRRPHTLDGKLGIGTMYILWWIIVGLIAGFITGKIMKGSGYGALGDIIVGIIGAIVGGFIMRALGHAGSGGLIYTIFVAVVGAVILTFLLRLLTGKRA
jgi:uncharacterized membrane protein YeaQ/YmgE (transglycosylase-associated protein family)